MGGKSGEGQPDGGVQIEAIDGLRHAAVGLGQELGAGDEAILLALGDFEVGEDHLGILFERQIHGILEGQIQGGGWLLRQAGSGQRQGERKAAFHPRLAHVGSHFRREQVSDQL